MILKSDVRGVITSIPPKRLAFRGNINTAEIAVTSPRPETSEHQPLEAAGPGVLARLFEDDIFVLAVPRLLISPIVSTTRALTTTIASGSRT